MSVRTSPCGNRMSPSLGRRWLRQVWTVRPHRPTKSQGDHARLAASRVRRWKKTPVSFGVVTFQDGTSSVNGKSATVSGPVHVPRRGEADVVGLREDDAGCLSVRDTGTVRFAGAESIGRIGESQAVHPPRVV